MEHSWQENSRERPTLNTAERYHLRLLLRQHILLLSLRTSAVAQEQFFQLLQKLPEAERKTWQQNYQSYPKVTAQRLQRRCWLEQQLTFFNGHKQCLQGRYAKPTLKNRCFFFNLSHSKSLTILALFHLPLGIDIEPLNLRKARSLFTILHPEEQRFLASLNTTQANQAFLRIWTRQEALSKLSGQAISRTLGKQALNWEGRAPRKQQIYFHEETYAAHYLCLVSRRPFKLLWWSDVQESI